VKKLGPGYLYLLATLVLWSTYEAVSKTLVGLIDPFQVNFIRFLVGGLIMFGVLAFRRDLGIGRRDLAVAGLAGLLNVGLSMGLIQMSLNVAGARASVTAVIFSSNPIFVTACAVLAGEERVRPATVAGLALGLAGALVIFLEKGGPASSDLSSPLLALASAASFGLYTVVGRKTSIRIGSLKMNAYSFVIGSLALLPLLLLSGVKPFEFDPAALARVGYLAVFTTGLAYLSYFHGLSKTSASTGSLVFFGKPVLASLVAALFLGESLSFNLAAGTLLILSGIAAALYWDRPR